MKKKIIIKLILFYLVFNSILINAQNSKLPIFENKTLNLKIKYSLPISITAEYSSTKYLNEVVSDEISERIYFNKNKEVSDVKASTYNINSHDNYELASRYLFEFDCSSYKFSDCKYIGFIYPNLKSNSLLKLKYNIDYNNIYLLNSFYFSEDVFTKESILNIECDNRIKLGYKLFNVDTNQLDFKIQEINNKKYYSWKMTNIKPIHNEAFIAPSLYNEPHIKYYIDYYINKNKDTVFINNNKRNLFDWVKTFVNLKEPIEKNVQEKAEEICTGITDPLIKAKALFYWVQKNIAYTAVEYGDLAFRPISATEVYKNKIGDCKGKSNLLYKFLLDFNYDAKLCWIGSIQLPYSLDDFSTADVFNHMIVYLKLNNKEYFLDPTDESSFFDIPSFNIAGKEVMIYDNDSNYIISKIPIIDADSNRNDYTINYQISENSCSADLKIEFFGYNKEVYKNIYNIRLRNENFTSLQLIEPIISNYTVENLKTSIDDNSNESPFFIDGKLHLVDFLKNIGEKFIFKPFIIQPFINYFIDTSFDKYSKFFKFKKKYKIKYNIQISDDFNINKIPLNDYFNNDIFSISLNSNFKNNNIGIVLDIELNKIFLSPSEFNSFNQAIEKLSKIYKQNILLTKNN